MDRIDTVRSPRQLPDRRRTAPAGAAPPRKRACGRAFRTASRRGAWTSSFIENFIGQTIMRYRQQRAARRRSRVRTNLAIGVPALRACTTDRIEDTINYAAGARARCMRCWSRTACVCWRRSPKRWRAADQRFRRSLGTRGARQAGQIRRRRSGRACRSSAQRAAECRRARRSRELCVARRRADSDLSAREARICGVRARPRARRANAAASAYSSTPRS